MPVTIKRTPVPTPAPIAAPTAAPADLRMRDRRTDPVGPAAKELLASTAPTKKQIKAAYEEFLLPLNRMNYYLDYARWWGVCQRFNALYKAMEKEDGKTAQGLTKQLWEAYRQIMKEGVFERRWGDEPQCA